MSQAHLNILFLVTKIWLFALCLRGKEKLKDIAVIPHKKI